MNYPDLFDTFLDSVLVIDKDKKIVYCNPASSQLTGLSQKRILKTDDLSKVIHFGNDNNHQKLNTGKYHELSYQCPNGANGMARILWQEIRELNHTVIILQDTTLEITLCNKYKNELEEKQTVINELKEAQKKLDDYNKNLEKIIKEKTKELEVAQKELIQSEKLASLGVITAGIAHEVNNPLTLIVAPLELMINELSKSGKDEALVKRAQKILNSAIRIANIIDDMKKFTQGDIIEQKQAINIEEIIEESILKFHPRLEADNIEILFIPYNNFPLLQGTPGLLEIVVEELINNAIDSFKDVKDSRNKKIKINLSLDDNQPTLEIIDNANGMDERTQNSLFDPFYTTKEVGKGKGLGLSVVYGIINRHNANITISSRPKEGTTFTITFEC